MTLRITIAIALVASIVAGLIGNVPSVHAQEQNTARHGILSDSRLGSEDDVYTATMDVQNGATWDRLYISFLHESTLPHDGSIDVYTTTLETVSFAQDSVMYTGWIYTPVKHSVMLAIAGQVGDESFDSAWYDLANDCTIIMVVDDANDSVSPFIYTRLACQLTDTQIEQLPEILGDSLYLMTNLYTVLMPVIAK